MVQGTSCTYEARDMHNGYESFDKKAGFQAIQKYESDRLAKTMATCSVSDQKKVREEKNNQGTQNSWGSVYKNKNNFVNMHLF